MRLRRGWGNGMTTAISSAGPDLLRRFAAVSAAQAEPVAQTTTALAAALSSFSATCTEYHVAVDGLPGRITALESSAGALSGWVTTVAAGFVAADTGGLRAKPVMLRTPEAATRTGFHIRISGPLGISVEARFQVPANTPGRLAARPLAVLGVAFTGVMPFFAPVIAYQGMLALQGWIVAQTQAPWFVDLQRSVGSLLRAAGVTLQGLTFAAQQLSTGRLITPANSLSAVLAALRSVGLEAPLRAALRDTYAAAWTSVGVGLLLTLRQMNRRLSGSLPSRALALPGLLRDVTPILLTVGVSVALLSTLGDGATWADLPPGADLPALLHRAFWIESQANLPPALLQPIAVELETLNVAIAALTASAGHVRPAPLPRSADGRVLETDFDAAFPPDRRMQRPDGTYALAPSVLMGGEQPIISYYRNEQVTLVRLTVDDYVVGMCGLDPQNMAYAPNGLSAVIETAYDGDTLRNAYYTHVRDELLRYLELIPPGSSVHFAGHSMGGGMAMQALSDPAVRAALAARNLTPTSLTTVGAVRPQGAGALPPNLEERHYVDPDDQLAMNVGAGHRDYADVVFVDDGMTTDPVAAHTGYDDADYSTLPADLTQLPFVVDPAQYAVYRLDPIGYQPVESPHEPPPLYP